MRRFCIAAACLLMTAPAVAQDTGYWKATSKTAYSVTGDIVIEPEKLVMNFSSFIMSNVRHAEGAEVSAVFDAPADGNPGANLYRLNIPAGKKFLHKNTLCGAEDTTYMMVYREDKTLQVAFFSGAAMPKLTTADVQNSGTLCGTYMYQK
jgi:hypothetical protein